jgi:hypothetical protein
LFAVRIESGLHAGVAMFELFSPASFTLATVVIAQVLFAFRK